MRPDTDVSQSSTDADLRQIPKWARRYAQNRTLPVIVNLCVFLMAFFAIAGLSYLAGWAYVTGKRPLVGVSVVLLAGFIVFWMWFSFVGGRRFVKHVTERLYRGEGQVSVGRGPDDTAARSLPIVGAVFGFCILAQVGLGFLGFIPIRYMQPVSALYLVPFLVYLGVRLGQMGQAGGSLMTLWPVLYGLHAILLVGGAPIYFSGPLEGLNMLIPTVGYGLLSACLAHLYSRFALRRLKRLAKAPGTADDGQEGVR